jgi:hypothetical protein
MILSNKFINITTNTKNIKSHNYIFDRYLKYVNLSQFASPDGLTFSRMNRRKIPYTCYIKFDTPIADWENAVYTDFDACIQNQSHNVTGKNNMCNATFIYNSSDSFLNINNEPIDINDYVGRKITALGFANYMYEGQVFSPEILAYIDVSEYNITITENEVIVITRSDDFTTNMDCVGIDYPRHLAPYSEVHEDSDASYTPVYARLYSIGFGSTKGYMREEYKLDDDEITINVTDTDFEFWLKTGEKYTIYPSQNSYPSSNKYPMKEYQFIEKYPSVNSYPSTSKYPMRANVKYIIFKYMLCYYDSYEEELVDINQTYTMNLYSPLIAYFKVRSKIERRDEI